MKKTDIYTASRRIFFLVALFCTLFSVCMRLYWESRDRDVLAVMSPEDISVLAAASGTPAAQWQALFGDWDSFTREPFDGVSDLPVALVENEDRTGMYLPENFSLDAYLTYGSVKSLYLYAPEYSWRATQDDAQAVQDLLFRAVTDRGMRLLILTPLHDAEGNLVTDIQVYRDCLNGLAERLEARGYTFGQRFSCLRNQKSNWQAVVGEGLLTLYLGLWLLCRIPRVKKFEKPLFYLGLIALFLLALLMPVWARKLLMLAGAVVFSCVAAWFVAEYVKQPDEKPLWQTILIFTAAFTGWSLLSGFNVGALMAYGQYMLGVSIFSGVKFSLLLPMAFGCLLLLWNLRKPLLQTGWKGWLGLAAVGAVLGGVLLVLASRSGDIAGGISSMETAFRNWLEYTLYVRPRTKEMLFAVPCIPVFLWACRRKYAPLQLLCGAGVCLECVSVVNTFCHAVAPLLVSVMRTLLGVGLGLIPGILAVLLLEGFHRLKTR